MAESDFTIDLVESGNDETSLILQGDLSIDNTMQIYDELLKKSNQSDFDTIELKNVTIIDLPVIQLIVSVIQSKKKKDKHIYTDIKLDSALLELLTNAGITDIFSVPQQPKF